MRPLREDTGGGRRQGRYVLGELLGRGGMAEVFAGSSMGSHGFTKPVAIKRLLPELANDEVFVERLISEAKLLVGMAHGNIVSVLDLARDGDDVFLVMEFVDGPSLRQLMKARGDRGVPLGSATYVVQAAAAGLEFAHGRPGGAVIHADISPSNILLTTSGEVRVADFGIARREGGVGGVVEGKWAYMAPEQARGEALTPRSDVFALGVVLYELMCGEHPLGRQVTAGERELEPKRIIPPRVMRPSIPAGLDAICMKALSYEPRDRYARMQHLIDALVDERFANGWREGANDLGSLIREVVPGSGPAKENTQHTNRPVTIVTRSLISQLNARASSPTPPGDDRDSVPKIADSGAQTRALYLEDLPAELRVRSDGTPSRPAGPVPAMSVSAMPEMPAVMVAPQAYQLSPDMLPSPELSSVHGGTFTGSAEVGVAVGPRNYKWAAGVLALAAVSGAIAAVITQLGGSSDAAPAKPFAFLPIMELPPAPPTTAVRAVPATTLPTLPATQATVPAQVAVQPSTTTATMPTPTPTVVAGTAAQAVPSANPDETVKPKLGEVRPRRNAQGRLATTVHKSSGTDGWLRIDVESGWADVVVAGQRKQTPRAMFHLPPGTYPVHFKNDDHGFTCKLTVDTNKTSVVNVSMDDEGCDED